MIYSFFSRVDRVLRRSLGVSETAPTDTTVKPAPPVDPELPEPEDFLSDKPGIVLPDHMKDQVISILFGSLYLWLNPIRSRSRWRKSTSLAMLW